MCKYFNHLVFRNYIALARGESFINQDGYAEKSLYFNYELGQKIVDIWQRSPQRQIEASVFEKPRFYENLLICGQLKNRFGEISQVPNFNKKGNLEIPRYVAFIVPEREGNLINGFNFYRIKQNKIVKL